MSKLVRVDEARELVSRASQILAMEGIVDAFGHASIRHPEDDRLFLMSRSRAPALVQQSDVLALNFDGAAVEAPDERLFLERFLHAEIYREHPDVIAVVHSHAADVVPYTVLGDAVLQPICHVCGFLGGTPVPFDVADHAGDASDLLISNADLGRQFARHMAGSKVGLMRSHGFTTVGVSMQEAVFNAVYTARNCAIQTTATILGNPKFLTPGEAEACERATAGQADRAWLLWTRQLEEKRS